ncbi:DUF4124 domain-containing protein [Catenovulum sp. SM1970]|uniref:DUF4124 domain-containing protein n=1 Tax=Marinifaba aquimaris TaxID=2741323 RepID=UPI001571B9AE|nr:DUF4124 domain-containing protein [Marinifaba aquimaris]NTS78572.1 DUF4124 domain-containing protein [Marinifaba aquimaris]
MFSLSVKTWLTALALVCSAQAVANKVYVYRNAEGVLVFSDAPQSDKKAEEVKLTTKPTVVPSEDTSVLQSQTQQVAQQTYSISLQQPLDQATIRDNTGSVYVTAGVKPSLKKGLKVQIYLDGKPYGQPMSRTTEILRNIDRGEHQIKMALINGSGKKIAETETNTFYLHRARAGG